MTKGKNGQRGNTKKCYKKTTQWLKEKWEKTNNGERNTTWKAKDSLRLLFSNCFYLLLKGIIGLFRCDVVLVILLLNNDNR